MIARKCRINATMVEFACSHKGCGAHLRVPSGWVGACVKCGKYVLAPAAKSESLVWLKRLT
jgi:hypothetical protein